MDFEPIIQNAAALGDARTAFSGDYAVVPENYSLEDLEGFHDNPRRARGSVTAQETATLIAYVNKYKTEAAANFADQTKFQIVSVLDYHTPAVPGWGGHRITYACPRSREWQTWRGMDGKQMKQSDFAVFIENNVVDIREPAGADVLEVSRSLQAQKAVKFASAIRLSDGTQEFTYSEEVSGTTTKGKLKVPEQFKLGIPVFFGGDSYEVIARLRYRIAEGALVLWYDLYRPEYIEQDAFKLVVSEVAEKTVIDVWMGTP